jgi:hypothetical protein
MRGLDMEKLSDGNRKDQISALAVSCIFMGSKVLQQNQSIAHRDLL